MAPSKILALLVCGATLGARMKKSAQTWSSSASGRVKVWGFGMPKISAEPLTMQGACIPGMKIVNEEFTTNTKDIVTWLMWTFKHARMQTRRLGPSNATRTMSCDWERTGSINTNVDLHRMKVYVERAVAYGGELGMVADMGLRYSYDLDIRAQVEAKGWDLIGTAVRKGETVSHLMQHPKSLECILTWEGTDRWEDWGYNLFLKKRNYCGVSGVHSGFVKSLNDMVDDSNWQREVRPRLGLCSILHVTGHSLGGAMGALFSVCAESNRVGDEFYDKISFAWQDARRIPPMGSNTSSPVKDEEAPEEESVVDPQEQRIRALEAKIVALEAKLAR